MHWFINTAAKHPQNVITAIKALQQNAQAKQILPIKRVYATNKSHEKQKAFFNKEKKGFWEWFTQANTWER